MQEKAIAGLLILAGIIHLLPVPGLFGVNRLYALYGTLITDPNLEILMRHRSVLFGLLGALLIVAAFLPGLQWLAATAGLVSALSFMLIAWLVGDYSETIRRVVIADVVATGALLLAVVLMCRPSRS